MCFDILTSGWRIFQKPIRTAVSDVEKYTISLQDYLKEYVNTVDGSVPWQLDYVRRYHATTETNELELYKIHVLKVFMFKETFKHPA